VPSEPFVTVSRSETRLGSDGAIEAARVELAERHHLVVRGLLEPELRDWLVQRVAAATFETFVHVATGAVDLGMRPDPAIDAVRFLLSDPVVLHAVERVAGCEKLSGFYGRVYRMIEGAAHFDEWHDDLDGDRRVAVSINLGQGRYEGGHLLLRDYATKALLADVHNVGLGDVLIFRLGDDFEHNITRVTGPVPKTAFAGWFCSKTRGPGPLARATKLGESP
jgi:hypothetical protein